MACVELGRSPRGHGASEFAPKFLGPNTRGLGLAGGAGGAIAPPLDFRPAPELLYKLCLEAGAVGAMPNIISAVRVHIVQERPESQPCWEGRVRLAPWEEA